LERAFFGMGQDLFQHLIMHEKLLCALAPGKWKAHDWLKK